MESQTPQQILDSRNENQVCYVTSLLGMQALSQEIINRNLNVISIREPEFDRDDNLEDQYSEIDALHVGRCFSVEFRDVSNDNGLGFAPTIKHIKSILDWSKKQYSDNGNMFMVHCFAGVSRSSSVAMLINYMVNGDLFATYDVRYHSPNKLILEFGAEILGFDCIAAINKIKTVSNAYFAGDEYKYEIF